MENEPEIRQIRCSKCGVFLGVGYVNEGEVYVYHGKGCKSWTAVLGAFADAHLTGEEMYAKIKSVDQKARKGQVSLEERKASELPIG